MRTASDASSGGFAAVLYGSPFVTTDIDVVPASDDENLSRLSDALKDLHARSGPPANPGRSSIIHGLPWVRFACGTS
jgi:hypothetical protein